MHHACCTFLKDQNTTVPKEHQNLLDSMVTKQRCLDTCNGWKHDGPTPDGLEEPSRPVLNTVLACEYAERVRGGTCVCFCFRVIYKHP